jgi:hypothetical protein
MAEYAVEAALAELIPTFPDAEIVSTTNARGTSWRIWLGMRGGNQYGESLDEAMAQVKQWKAEGKD